MQPKIASVALPPLSCNGALPILRIEKQRARESQREPKRARERQSEPQSQREPERARESHSEAQ
eukprot:2714080-Karenia_brevis.AAC.1